MGLATCGEGHAYTPGNGCPTCRQDGRTAYRRERRAARQVTRDVALHQSTARGVPKQVEDDPWREQAACQYQDGDAWFADQRNTEAVEHALAMCAGCPVLVACRDYARRTRQPWGVWGGETAAQRGTAYKVRYGAL